ncbi:MAG: sulfatase-like hydrolase/transferase [Opitutaceae bacterium]
MRAILTLVLSLAFANVSIADVLVGWDNDPTVHGSENWASSYNATGINAATVTTGSGISAKLTSGGPDIDQAMKYTGLHARNIADAVTNNEYISFTLNSNADAFQIDSIEISDVNMNVGSTLMMELRSSVDGFTTTLSSNSTTNAAGQGIENFATSGISELSNVEFRLYFYWVTNGNENSSIHFRSDKTSIDQFPDAAGTTLTDPILLVNGSVFFDGVAYITDFSATPDNFIDSDSVQLTWSTIQAKRLEISNDTSSIATYTTSVDGQSFINSGSLALGTISETTTYTLTATFEENGSGDTVTEQTTVTVIHTTDIDTDRDGLSDAEEADTYSTDPSNPDSDGDGTPDGLEVTNGLDPNDPNESLDRPNIIVFFTDDQGWGDLGCFWQDQKSGSKFDTPVLDSLAAEGAKLTHHYVSAPICLPSRSSLLQGRHQGHSGLRNIMFDSPLPDNHTIADTLRLAGYRTIHIGKNGVAGGEGSVNLSGNGSQNLEAHPLKRGFDEFFGYLFHGDAHEHYPRNGNTNKTAHIYHDFQQVNNASLDLYTTDAFTAYAKDAIIREHNDSDNQPFFLYLAYDAPHFNNQRPAVAYPSGGGLNGGIQWTTATDGSGMIRYASTADGTGTVDGYNHPDNDAGWTNNEKQLVGMIRRIDNSIGDIVQLLKDLGIDDNTMIVFTTDNGPDGSVSRGVHTFESYANFEGTKQDILEGGSRVPTIVRWPGKIAGATNDEANILEIDRPAITYDWMPTFAEMAGVTAPSWCDGVSLLPTLTGQGIQRDKGYLYTEFRGYLGTSVQDYDEFPTHGGRTRGETQFVRIGNYMGIRMDIQSAADPFEIYDVTTDTKQANDLAGVMPDLEAQMRDIALQTRRPHATATRPYDSALVPNSDRELEPGLRYYAYEGIWSYVPEFRDIRPIRTAPCDSIDLSLRARDQHHGLLFSGYIDIPTGGDYTFHLSSDSGANFFIHEAHVIDDDYHHDRSEQSGTTKLEAGLHPFRLYYRHATASIHELELSWEGPSITKQTIPASAFYRIPEIKTTVGVQGSNLNFNWNSLGDQTYRLRANQTLLNHASIWPIIEEKIPPSPPVGSLSIPMPNDERMFYIIEEE